jgi:hypothetical protein
MADDKRAQLEAFLRDKRPWDERSHHEWLAARNLTDDPQEQAAFAPAEHRAFAREYVRDNPLTAPAIPLAALGYLLGKKVGLVKGTRTPADADQVWAAVEGTGQGLADAFKK